MQIKFVHKADRNQLVCERKDGSFERVRLGPNLPEHDIAHFVVERQLSLRKGFYGNIYDGYSIQQLSDKEIIKKLHIHTAVSEITTRALQSLSTGAATVQQFLDLIYEEFNQFSIVFPLQLNEEIIKDMLLQYNTILKNLEELREGDSFTLYLDMHNDSEVKTS